MIPAVAGSSALMSAGVASFPKVVAFSTAGSRAFTLPTRSATELTCSRNASGRASSRSSMPAAPSTTGSPVPASATVNTVASTSTPAPLSTAATLKAPAE